VTTVYTHQAINNRASNPHVHFDSTDDYMSESFSEDLEEDPVKEFVSSSVQTEGETLTTRALKSDKAVQFNSKTVTDPNKELEIQIENIRLENVHLRTQVEKYVAISL
jgi:hypothetical protein